jgi:hypothetical protein
MLFPALSPSMTNSLLDEFKKLKVWKIKYPDSYGMEGRTYELLDKDEVEKLIQRAYSQGAKDLREAMRLEKKECEIHPNGKGDCQDCGYNQAIVEKDSLATKFISEIEPKQ